MNDLSAIQRLHSRPDHPGANQPAPQPVPVGWKQSRPLLVLLACILFFTYGCDSGDTSGNAGKVEIWLHDAPADFEEVQIFVKRVEIGKQEEGWIVLGEPEQHFDLLRLTNGNYEIIGADQIEAGTYHQLRLILSPEESYVMEAGEKRSLFVPSGAQTGLKLNIHAEIEENSHYVLLLDFDAERSIVKPGQGGQPADYILKPVIRTTSLTEAGHIGGIVSPPVPAVVFAISGQDTLSTTYTDEQTGEFLLFGLSEGDYQVSIQPKVEGSEETVVEDVPVTPGETHDLGIVELTL